MKTILSRAAMAVCLLMPCSSICLAQTQTQLLCVANDTPECSSHNPQPGLSPAYLNCSVWPQINQLSQDPATGLGKLWCGANNLYSASTVVHTGGQSCTVEMADVKCREGATSSAQLCIGGSCPSSLVDYPCQFAWNHPTDTDVQAASAYCSSQNLGVLAYYRVRSEGGGACGRIYDNVSCGTYNNVGNVYPHYMVMTILYAPPGCGSATQTCSGSNSVEYSNQSSAGSELTISHDQDQTYSFEASAGPKVFQGQYSFDKEKSTTDSHDQSVTKSSQSTLTLDGAAADGIDHENDTFYFLLNPAISIQALGNTLTWNLDVRPLNSSYHAGDPLYQTLTVRELKHPSTIWASKRQVFTDAQVRLTDPHTDPNSDIPRILALDPFANGLRYQLNGQFLWPDDPYYNGRYRKTTIGGIPYSGSPGSPCVTGQGNITNSFSDATTQESKVTYTEKAEASSGIDDVYSITVGGEVALTNSSTLETSTGGSQSATLQLSCPTHALEYANVDVFWDLVYGTFLFVPGENRSGGITGNNTYGTAESYRGTIISSCGGPIPRLPIDLETNGVVFHTFSNERGEFGFSPHQLAQATAKSSTAVVSVNGVRKKVSLGSHETIDVCGHEVQPRPVVVGPGARIPPMPETAPVHTEPIRPPYPGPAYQPPRQAPAPFPAPVPSPSALRCSAPFVAGTNGKCACPQGTVQTGNDCVQLRGYPQQPGAGATPARPQVSCPSGTVPSNGRCVKALSCTAPQVPNDTGTGCTCPSGSVLRGNECIRQDKREPRRE